MSHTLTNITLKIWRQDGPDGQGRFETHQIPEISDEASFLEMLDILNERLIEEGREAIVFDHDCREGICGTCSLMIDGQAHGPQKGAATCQLHMRDVRLRRRDRDRTVAGDRVPDHQGPDGRPGAVRPHRRVGRLHHRADRWCPRRQPDPDPEAGRRRGDGQRRLHRLRCLRGGVPERCGDLFTAAKLTHLNLLPQGQAERYKRAEAMVETMEEYFGSCTNHGECSSACPKEISIDSIAMMNADYRKSKFKNRKALSRR